MNSILISKDDVRNVFISSGFKIKEGQEDLAPYVYEAAFNLIMLINNRDRAAFVERVAQKFEGLYTDTSPQMNISKTIRSLAGEAG